MATGGLRKAWLWLGLGDDEDYDYDAVDVRDAQEARPSGRPPPGAQARVGHTAGAARPGRAGAGANAPAAAAPPRRNGEAPHADDVRVMGTVRPLTPQPAQYTGPPGDGGPGSSRRTATAQTVRPLPAPVLAKPHVISPTTFNEAQEVADKYKSNVPVIVNLQAADRDLSRRLIDFTSGLCYGLGGSMERVANQVYLLTPSSVEVSAEERQRLQERGFYD
jgi:cell division inhibitor SepF